MVALNVKRTHALDVFHVLSDSFEQSARKSSRKSIQPFNPSRSKESVIRRASTKLERSRPAHVSARLFVGLIHPLMLNNGDCLKSKGCLNYATKAQSRLHRFACTSPADHSRPDTLCLAMFAEIFRHLYSAESCSISLMARSPKRTPMTT